VLSKVVVRGSVNLEDAIPHLFSVTSNKSWLIPTIKFGGGQWGEGGGEKYTMQR